MDFCCFLLLLAVVTFHTSSYSLVAAALRGDKVSRLASVDSSLIHRRLRVLDAHFPDSENRGDGITSLIKSIQVRKWFQTGKTDDFVKKALKLDDLSEDAMIASPQYKYYVKFRLKKEGQWFNQWLKDGDHGLPPRKAWARLGLENMDRATLEKSSEYKAFLRYEKMYDAGMYQRMDDWFKAGKSDADVKKALRLDRLPIGDMHVSTHYKYYRRYTKLRDDEMNPRVDDWFEAGKSDDFVMDALGLDGLSIQAMKVNPNYKYYVRFLLKTESQHFKDWLKEGETGLPTYWAWERLGLLTVDPARRDQTAAYEAYMRYAKLYDDTMYARVSKDGHKAFRAMIGPLPEETNALVRLWAATKRPDWYVEKMLGSTSLGKQYFEEFLQQRKLLEQAAKKRGG